VITRGRTMRWILGLGLALTVTGSAAAAESVKVELPSPITVAPLPAGAKAHPISLTRVAANMAPGTAWSDITLDNMICGLNREIGYWKESNNQIGSLSSFDRSFNEVLKASGFVGGRDPTNLFEEQTKSDLQVGALITDVKLKTCPNVTFGRQTDHGDATMDVEWQVYSVTQAKIIARLKTHGGASEKNIELKNTSVLIMGAFADNVRRLAANDEFRRLATEATSSSPPPRVAQAPLTFAPASGAVPIAGAVRSVVVIYAGDASGSGFVISPDGYILTNHHVAGDQGRVRVHWADGTDTVGEVVRADRRRDVALIRTTSKAPALALRKDQSQLGEAVFAVGTPLEKEFQNTLTKGIVSGNRLLDGLTFIQSDVAVDHGNSGGPLLDEKGQVLGLTQWGYAPDGVSHNLNFFIPIGDALKALALEPAPVTVAAAAAPSAASATAAKRKRR